MHILNSHGSFTCTEEAACEGGLELALLDPFGDEAQVGQAKASANEEDNARMAQLRETRHLSPAVCGRVLMWPSSGSSSRSSMRDIYLSSEHGHST